MVRVYKENDEIHCCISFMFYIAYILLAILTAGGSLLFHKPDEFVECLWKAIVEVS